MQRNPGVSFISSKSEGANDNRPGWSLDYAIQRTRERGYADVVVGPLKELTSVGLRRGRQWVLCVRNDLSPVEIAAVLQLACEGDLR